MGDHGETSCWFLHLSCWGVVITVQLDVFSSFGIDSFRRFDALDWIAFMSSEIIFCLAIYLPAYLVHKQIFVPMVKSKHAKVVLVSFTVFIFFHRRLHTLNSITYCTRTLGVGLLGFWDLLFLGFYVSNLRYFWCMFLWLYVNASLYDTFSSWHMLFLITIWSIFFIIHSPCSTNVYLANDFF